MNTSLDLRYPPSTPMPLMAIFRAILVAMTICAVALASALLYGTVLVRLPWEVGVVRGAALGVLLALALAGWLGELGALVARVGGVRSPRLMACYGLALGAIAWYAQWSAWTVGPHVIFPWDLGFVMGALLDGALVPSILWWNVEHALPAADELTAWYRSRAVVEAAWVAEFVLLLAWPAMRARHAARLPLREAANQ